MASADRFIEVFHRAQAYPAREEREQFLAEACRGDPEFREQVDSLLAAHESAGDFLNSLTAPPTVLVTERPGDTIGRYKLRELLGEGGCGVVYVADQEEPVRRRVALKVIKLGMDTRQVVARFEVERQALAMMDHPNIAKVLDAGTTEAGRPYFVMELVRGVRITEYCDRNGLGTRERLGLFIQVCQAIQHAHQKGVIHRDIKPSNILVTLHDGPAAAGCPKVIDFGIAKATEGRLTDGTVYTQLLQFIGTPAYMSPEQAEMSSAAAGDIDTRSDVYSLGVLLYELLTGNTPFDAEELMASGIDAMRKTVREREPARPSTRLTRELAVAGPGSRKSTAGFPIPSAAEVSADSRRRLRLKEQIHRIRGDLDWIVMKCLEKDRTRRYETANGLAADIERHLANEPIIARPPTSLYRLQKLVRRNKLAFAAAAAVVAALLVGLFFASTAAVRALAAERVASRNAYALEINAGFHALAENNLGRARDLLERHRPKPGDGDLPSFEWRHLWKLCQGDEFRTFPDEGARAAAFSPDGKLLAYAGDTIVVRETDSWGIVKILPGPAETLSFAPRTQLLASGNTSGVDLWDTQTWQKVRSLPGTMFPSLFSPDGRWLLTGVPDAYRVWDTRTWQPMGDCPDVPDLTWQSRNAVAFSPNGQFLVTVAGENELGDRLRVWRLPNLERLTELRFGHRDRLASVAFSADGNRLVTGLWDGQLVVREFPTGNRVATPVAHTFWLSAVSISPDGETMATAGDRTIQLRNARTFEHLARLRGHGGAVWSLAMSPDGHTLVSGSQEGTTKLWRAGTRYTAPVLAGFGLVAGFTGRGRQLVALSNDRWCVWTPETGARVDFPIPSAPPILVPGMPLGQPCDVNPDEPLGALGRDDGTLEIWHLMTGARVSAWPAHRDGIAAVAFSPDGKRLATTSLKGEMRIWNFATQREVGRLGPLDFHPLCLAFSPDGKTLAASGTGSSVWLWDTSTRDQVRQLSGHFGQASSVAFSPDGTLLAIPSMAGDVRLWEPRSTKEPVTLNGHIGSVGAVAFSPDGKTLATGGIDQKVKLWNIATRQELVTFPVPMLVGLPTLKFSPDGRLLAIGERTRDDPHIHIVQAPSLEDIAEVEAQQAVEANP